mgnify:CR=1 FL=1
MKKGFSLPEALITLVIIGVVSAILLPSLIRNFSEGINSHKEASVANKITQAMENMNAAGELNYYPTTEEFVEALSKHLKISKICDKDHLTDCWSSKTVRTYDGNTYEVKNAKTGWDLHTGNATNNVGLVLGDGSQIILTYNPNVGASAGDNVTGSKKTLPIGFGKTKDFAYTTSITSAIDYVVDVNGPAGPNAETTDDGEFNDIRSFRAAAFSIGRCPGVKIDGICTVNLGNTYPALNCTEEANEKYCVSTSTRIDYFAGAKKTCSDLGMTLASKAETRTLLGNKNYNYFPSGYYISINSLAAEKENPTRYIRITYNADTHGMSETWVSRDNHDMAVCVR